MRGINFATKKEKSLTSSREPPHRLPAGLRRRSHAPPPRPRPGAPHCRGSAGRRPPEGGRRCGARRGREAAAGAAGLRRRTPGRNEEEKEHGVDREKGKEPGEKKKGEEVLGSTYGWELVDSTVSLETHGQPHIQHRVKPHGTVNDIESELLRNLPFGRPGRSRTPPKKAYTI